MNVAVQFNAPEEEARDIRTGADALTKQSVIARCEQIAAAAATQPKESRKALKALRKAVKALKKQDYKAAALAAVDATEADPKQASARHVLAVSLEKLGQLRAALEHYEVAQQLDPTDADVYLNLGLLAWKLNMVEGAEKFFRIHLRMRPDSIEGLNNLGGSLRDQGKFEEAVQVLQGAIYANQDSGMLWNSMGTIMVEKGDYDNAMTFYNEAARLEPELGRAYHNMGYALSVTGPLEKAIEAFDTGLKYAASASDAIEGRHGRALCLIGSSQLEEGWREYETRHDPLYHDQTLFNIAAPKWTGEPLAGKRLLLVGEQGLGDEILFLNTFNELIEEVGPDGQVFIACTDRLVPLFARTFPEAKVGRHGSQRHNGKVLRTIPWLRDIGEIDYFTPFGSVLQHRRTSLEAFPADPPRLKPDPERVAHWRARFETLGPGPYVGVAWRSMLMSVQRSKYFSPLSDWAPVFANKNIQFINLQYGDITEELEAIKGFGANIWNPEDINLTNDLDDVTALSAALDLAICPPNAAMNLAACAGVPTWIITSPTTWTRLGEAERFPWYPNSRCFMPEEMGAWRQMMDGVAGELSVYTSNSE